MNIITNNKWIGQRTIRPDGADKVTGRAAFAADTTMPGMIWGKVKRSPHVGCGLKNRADNLVVTGAPAQIAGQPEPDFLFARPRSVLQQRFGGDQHA